MIRKTLFAVSGLVVLLALLATGYLFKARASEDVAFLNRVRYEPGEHRGAAYCGSCHEQIYREWLGRSRHAISTTAQSVREVMEKLGEHRILDFVLGGEDMCYACHGPEAPGEGVNCETCHGTVLPDTPIMVTHEKKYAPGRSAIRRAEFCAECHEIPGFVTPYSDWQGSAAAAAGATCQTCHMATTGTGLAYHGFDSFVIDERIYDGDVVLDAIRYDFPTLHVTISNHIPAHSIPAGGPTRILALELSFLDAGGSEVHRDIETFAKYHSLIPILGFWPAKVIADTQLKTGERRPLRFTVPAELQGRIDSIRLILRFYEVADEHEGRLEHAYFASDPILTEVVRVGPA